MLLINTYPKNSKKQLANLGLRKDYIFLINSNSFYINFLNQSKSKTKFLKNSAEPEIKL